MSPALEKTPAGPQAAAAVAEDYQRQVAVVADRAARALQRFWRDAARETARTKGAARGAALVTAWSIRLPEAVAVVTAAQVVAADMADGYADAVLAAQGATATPHGRVAATALAGISAEGVPLADLMNLPALRAAYATRNGVPAQVAVGRARADLVKYARTETADAARAGSQVAGVARRIGGYVRHLRLPSCSSCAILAGRWYRWSAGFNRHPHCDCVHVPATEEVGRSLTTDPRTAILTGQVHGLSKAEFEAIRLGADPGQVVNARRGMYVAGDGRRYTTTGTTRRGVAGARLISAALNRAQGGPAGLTYRQMTLDRLTLLEATRRHEGLLRRGTTFTRRYSDGSTQTAAYAYSASPRASVADLLASATSQDEARRLLVNHGYLI